MKQTIFRQFTRILVNGINTNEAFQFGRISSDRSDHFHTLLAFRDNINGRKSWHVTSKCFNSFKLSLTME